MIASTQLSFPGETNDKIRDRESPSKIFHVPHSQIKELEESLASQNTSMPDPDRATKIDANESPILMKTEKIKSQVIYCPEIPPKLDPGIYELIDKKPQENGTQYTFKQIDMNDEQYEKMTQKIFPAVVFDFEHHELMQRDFSAEWVVLEKLGYEFDFVNKIITLPDCDLLNASCQQIAKDYPGLASFEAIPCEGTASDSDFIAQFVAGKTILSSDIEFTHDHLAHILSELLLRIKGEHSVIRDVVNTMMIPIVNVLKKAEDQIKKTTELTEDMFAICIDIKQLTSICAAWIDTKTPDVFNPIKKFDDHSILLFINNLYSFSLHRTLSEPKLIKRCFDAKYPEARLTRNRARYLTILLSIILFPEFARFDGYSIWTRLNLIKKDLKEFVVTWDKTTSCLSFKSRSDESLEVQEWNIVDHPVEVMELLRKAMRVD